MKRFSQICLSDLRRFESWQRRWARKTGTIPAADPIIAANLRRESPPDRLKEVARYSGARLISNANLKNSKKNRDGEGE
jgi:hypothetical protein